MRYVWIPIVAAWAWIAAMFFVSGAVFASGIVICAVLAIFVLAGALTCIKVYRTPALAAESNVRVGGAALAVGLVAAGATIVACVGMAIQAASMATREAKSVITASNLRGLGQCLHVYANDFGTYPPSLGVLVDSGRATPGQLQSFCDPNVNWAPDAGAEVYSSFVYQPGSGPVLEDADVILAFERQPWTPAEIRMFPALGRYVLFADGHAKRLSEEEFAEACIRDAQRRAEIGWPLWHRSLAGG